MLPEGLGTVFNIRGPDIGKHARSSYYPYELQAFIRIGGINYNKFANMTAYK